jgi:hypothetical protein
LNVTAPIDKTVDELECSRDRRWPEPHLSSSDGWSLGFI